MAVNRRSDGSLMDTSHITAPNDADRHPSNVMMRANYLRGLAARMKDPDDREFLLRAARSLQAYADHLSGRGS